MNRRNFFATLFGGLLCKWLPKRAVVPFADDPFPDSVSGTWRGINRCDYPRKETCGYQMTSYPGSELFCNAPKGHEGNHYFQTDWQPGDLPVSGIQYSVSYVTRNGYITAPFMRSMKLPLNSRL